MRMTAKYDDGTIEVEFSAVGYENDYMVDRSPTWFEWKDEEIETLKILGVEIKDINALPAELISEILGLAYQCEFKVDQ